MMKTPHPGRNDPCWCGSGRKYKRCHLNRIDETPLPFEAIAADFGRHSSHRVCMHPMASPERCGKVISAHTIQRARILRAIADNKNHVMSFYPIRPGRDGKPTVRELGWRQASTFTAFCDKHDYDAFSSLETKPYSKDLEQVFLAAYRAVCWELYQKIGAIEGLKEVAGKVDRGVPLDHQLYAQELLAIQTEGLRKGKEELERIKKQMDQDFLMHVYSIYEFFEIEFKGDLSIASIGAIAPNRTIKGNELQVLHNSIGRVQNLMFATVLGETTGSILFVWRKNEESPRRYISELSSLGDQQLINIVPQFLFAHCENVYFSHTWWDSLSQENQGFVRDLVSISNPYYTPIPYNLEREFVPWQIVSRNMC